MKRIFFFTVLAAAVMMSADISGSTAGATSSAITGSTSAERSFRTCRVTARSVRAYVVETERYVILSRGKSLWLMGTDVHQGLIGVKATINGVRRTLNLDPEKTNCLR